MQDQIVDLILPFVFNFILHNFNSVISWNSFKQSIVKQNELFEVISKI